MEKVRMVRVPPAEEGMITPFWLNSRRRTSATSRKGKGTRHVVNRAATALRQAANTLIRSRSYLGAQYRRLRTKLGAPRLSPQWTTDSPDLFIAC